MAHMTAQDHLYTMNTTVNTQRQHGDEQDLCLKNENCTKEEQDNALLLCEDGPSEGAFTARLNEMQHPKPPGGDSTQHSTRLGCGSDTDDDEDVDGKSAEDDLSINLSKAGRFRWRVTEGFFLLDAVKQVHKAKKFTLGLKSPAWLSVSKEIHAKGGRKIPPKLCAIKWRTLAKSYRTMALKFLSQHEVSQMPHKHDSSKLKPWRYYEKVRDIMGSEEQILAINKARLRARALNKPFLDSKPLVSLPAGKERTSESSANYTSGVAPGKERTSESSANYTSGVAPGKERTSESSANYTSCVAPGKERTSECSTDSSMAPKGMLFKALTDEKDMFTCVQIERLSGSQFPGQTKVEQMKDYTSKDQLESVPIQVSIPLQNSLNTVTSSPSHQLLVTSVNPQQISLNNPLKIPVTTPASLSAQAPFVLKPKNQLKPVRVILPNTRTVAEPTQTLKTSLTSTPFGSSRPQFLLVVPQDSGKKQEIHPVYLRGADDAEFVNSIVDSEDSSEEENDIFIENIIDMNSGASRPVGEDPCIEVESEATLPALPRIRTRRKPIGINDSRAVPKTKKCVNSNRTDTSVSCDLTSVIPTAQQAAGSTSKIDVPFKKALSTHCPLTIPSTSASSQLISTKTSSPVTEHHQQSKILPDVMPEWFREFSDSLLEDSRKQMKLLFRLHQNEMEASQKKNGLLASLDNSLKELSLFVKDRQKNMGDVICHRTITINGISVPVSGPRVMFETLVSPAVDNSIKFAILRSLAPDVMDKQYPHLPNSDKQSEASTSKTAEKHLAFVESLDSSENIKSQKRSLEDSFLKDMLGDNSSAFTLKKKKAGGSKTVFTQTECVPEVSEGWELRKSFQNWTELEEDALIVIFAEMHEEFQKKTKNQNLLWEEVAAKLAVHNISASPQQARFKWASMKKKWSKAVKSGDVNERPRFYDVFNALFGNDMSYIVLQVEGL